MGQLCINTFTEERAVYKIKSCLKKKKNFFSGFHSDHFILRVKTDLKHAALSHELWQCHFYILA